MAMTRKTKRNPNRRPSRKPGQKMSDNELVGFLGQKINNAINRDDGDLSEQRKKIMERYRGEPYGDERKGYSKYRSREILETVEWILPAVLKVFLSSERVVEFTPIGQGDIEQAKMETDAVNYKLRQANGGKSFMAFYSWFKDCLLQPTAYAKVYVEEKEKRYIEHYEGVNEFGLNEIEEDDSIKILEQDSEVVELKINGETQFTETFDLKIRRTVKQSDFCFTAIPGEEALIDPGLLGIDIDDGDFSAHRVQKSYTDLRDIGVSDDVLQHAGTSDNYDWGDERVARLFYADEDPEGEEAIDDPSMRMFWTHECTVKVDFDGDGLAETRRVLLIGHEIVENEETDFQPLIGLSSIPMPHKHNGMGIAEIVEDLQQLHTVLTRQMLDNIYAQNVRKKFFNVNALVEDGSTLTAMMNREAEFVPILGDPRAAVNPDISPSMIGDLLPVLQHFNERQQNRSGISPQLAMDPAVLQQATMGAFMGALEESSKRVEMLIRIIAETGMRPLMEKTRQLMRKHPEVFEMPRRGAWQQVDPSQWQDRDKMHVNVGLGYNSPAQLVTMLVQVLGMQREAIQAGLANPEKIYNTFERLTEAANIGDVSTFFVDPQSSEYQPPQPPPPDPMIQAQAQALMMDGQSKMMTAQSRSQSEAAKLKMEAMERQERLKNEAKKTRLAERKQMFEELKYRESKGLETELLLKQIEKLDAETEHTVVDMFKVASEFASSVQTAIEAGQEAVKAAPDG